jgi:thioredoxin 1
LQFLKEFINNCYFITVIKLEIKMVEHLTSKNFEEQILKSDIPIVVDFYADWCMPCKMMAPVFEKLSKEFEGKIKFLKLNTQAESQIAGGAGVQSIPTLIFMRDGRAVGKSVGFIDEDALRDKLNSIIR